MVMTIHKHVFLEPIHRSGLRTRLARLRDRMRAEMFLRSGSIVDAHRLAGKRYRPRPVAFGQGLLVRTPKNAGEESWVYWKRILGPGIQTETFDCDHLALRRTPNARLVSRLISSWLT